ncbi:MAG: hypothetical protein C4288_10620 [Leptolyngbya sp. ERB_1_1]
MSDVFISYSRKDKAFVERLHNALKEQGRETWVDWDAIEWTEDWWNAIERGIEGTNTFVFVISPDSVASQHCNAEIDHAVKHNKRLVPIVYREVAAETVHQALGKLNWLFLRERDRFESTVAELIEAIETDLTYVQAHTRLEVRAIEWAQKGRNESFVLRGDDLKEAESWLGQGKEPHPTELQREYLRSSRTTEEANQILFAAGQTAKRMVQIGSGVLAVTLVGAAIAGGFAWKAARDGEEARAEARIERAVAGALRQFDADQAGGLRMAMMAGFELQKLIQGKSVDQYPAISPILALQSGLERIRETKIPSNQGFVRSVAFSSDGTRMATAGYDGSIKFWDKNGKLITTINSNQGFVRSVAFSPDGSRMATAGYDGSTKLWDKDGNQVGQFEGSLLAFSPDWQRIAIAEKPSYFGAPLPNAKATIINLYRVDLDLNSLLRRACQRLKPYILDDSKQKTEQAQCEAQLGKNWAAERIAR